MEGLPKKGAGKNCAERKEGRNGSHQTRLRRLPRCSGKVTIPHTSASTPPTAMPTIRKGNSTSHTSGYSTKASSASGQHSTNRISQSRKWIIAYTYTQNSPLKFIAATTNAWHSSAISHTPDSTNRL